MTENPATLPSTIRVVLPLPLADSYDYLPLPNQTVSLGSLVEVPFGKKKSFGVIWDHGTGAGVAPEKLKTILSVHDLPPLPATTRQFVEWVAQYTVSPIGSVLKMVLGNPRLLEPKKHDISTCSRPNPDHHQPHLEGAQERAASYLVTQVQSQKYSTTLLDGVTGSGKTEVFCEAIAACLRKGQQALVLLPEISMTAALINRLTERFGAKPTEWHSELSEKQRRLNWHAIIHGEATFILGARSALFLPYPNLGLIVVDEEHESAYKQEEGVIYNGRDMAVVRAHVGNIPIILSSATPSLETVYNVQQGKYGHVVLKERFGNAAMPSIKMIDMREYKMSAQSFITPPLFESLKQTLAEKKQAMLFLNRRGYAPLTLCRGCGHRLQCPQCTSWLIEHKRSNRLHCHHCNFTMREPTECPSCGAKGRFAACGPGVERVAEEVRTRLPNARLAIMASDVLDSPKAAQDLVNQMANHELDLLIGTQIMAKGYHFPRLTLVGVIDADLGLSGGDPRAAERTFQLLQQISGRSGRAEELGHVLLQSTAPDHPVMQAIIKGDRDAFMATELHEREVYHLPPLWRLAHITVSGGDNAHVIAIANQLAAQAPRGDNLRVLGPAPAPFAMLRGRYRHRILIQTPRSVNLSLLIREWIGTVKIPKTLRVLIDIDPYSFL